MIKFYLPFYYLFFSRLKTKIDLVSWIIIFIIPQFIITYLYIDLNLWVFLLLFLLSQVIFNTLYEIGYIENDVSTTKNEKSPTLRLDQESYNYIKGNYFKIILFRYFTVLFFTGLLLLINYYLKLELNILYFILLLGINRLFFYWHNVVRNRLNILTFTTLAFTKYIFPIVLFVNCDKVLYLFFISFVAFPLLRIIEHSTHKRYSFMNYANFIGNHDKFRIIYYIFFILLVICLYIFSNLTKYDFTMGILILVYFLFFRILSYILLKKGFYKRDDLKNKDLYIKDS